MMMGKIQLNSIIQHETNFWVTCTGVIIIPSGPEGQNQLPILST